MRSVLQALIVKIFLLQFSVFHAPVVSAEVMDCTFTTDWKWKDGSFKLTEQHEKHPRKYQNQHLMQTHSIHFQGSNRCLNHFTRYISLLQENIYCKYTTRFILSKSMWTKVLILLALRVFFTYKVSSELQFLTFMFIQMESSIATVAPSLVVTSSSHVIQSPGTLSNPKTDSAISHSSSYYYKGECDLGWYQFGKYCYLPANELKIFDHAQRACTFHNANLLSISSEEENAIAFNISRRYLGFPNTNFLWIGMERRKSTKRLHWIDGIDLKYQNWIFGEPDSNGACVRMIGEGLWEDIDCFHKMPFICKKRGSHPLPYSRTTELGIMVGIPITFIFIVLTFVGILIFRSIKDADDTFFGYGKNRNKEKMHAALVDLSTSIAHVKTQPTPRPTTTTPAKKASRSNSSSHSLSSSHVNPAIEVSDFGSQSPIKIAKKSGNGRVAVGNNNKEKSVPEEIQMQVSASTFSIESQREDPSEIATSLDHLVTLKPKSRRLKGLRKPEATVRPPGKEGMYRLKTYV